MDFKKEVIELSKRYIQDRIEKECSYYSIFNDVFSIANIGSHCNYHSDLIEDYDIEEYLDLLLMKEYGVEFQEVIDWCEKTDEKRDESTVEDIAQSIAKIRKCIEGQISVERYKTVSLIDILNRLHSDDDILGEIEIYEEDGDKIKYRVIIEGQDFAEKFCEKMITRYLKSYRVPFISYVYDW